MISKIRMINPKLTPWLPRVMVSGMLLFSSGCSLLGLQLNTQKAAPGSTPVAEPAQVSNYRQNLNNAIQNGQYSQEKSIEQVEKQ